MLNQILSKSDAELKVSFGYQCLGSWETPCDGPKEISTLGNDVKRQQNKSTFSCLSGAALSANATLANTNICKGLIGTWLLPG